MKILAYIFKVIWRLKLLASSSALFLFYKSFPKVFFSELGWGTRFYGAVRFGNIGADIRVGKNCVIGRYVYLSAAAGATLSIGDGSSINTGGHIVAVYGIDIGRNVMIGEYVTIRDQNHAFEDTERLIRDQGYTGGVVRIGDDVWIGRGSIVCAGVCIGQGCVVGANSVVTRSLPPYSVAVGAPAKVIRMRGDVCRNGEAAL